ncbi:hypothetical protein ASD97_26135 [Streptomyces sp. Root63]|uniref:hypothetical protein n=1 Tax=unclassified Streptomyces TaxID=2593676 RepID=UPI0006F4E0BD|nr:MULTISPECIES: hypothetical protein [unclassified Streptomyces]KQX43550.1 hypothetical protein ASD29_32435 [Streptomyces sp. Root1295]KRA34114.1 hypothetical protein ASD97_26135 [Streptomyces sp. Root63]
MSYTDLRDFDCEYREVFEGEHNGEHEAFVVEIEKLGGGTVGKQYTGEYWRYIAKFSGGKEIARGQDFHMGMPSTHQNAAEAVFDMVCNTEEIRGY